MGEKELEALLRRYANHKALCHCFICRNLTIEEQRLLEELRAKWTEAARN